MADPSHNDGVAMAQTPAEDGTQLARASFTETSTMLLDAMSATQIQQMVEHALSRLGPVASSLSVLFSQAEHLPPGIQQAGFRHVLSYQDLMAGATVDLNANAFLVVRVGGGLDTTIEIVRNLNQSQDSPPIIVLMLVASLTPVVLAARGNGNMADIVAYEVEVGRSLANIRAQFYEAGADETLCLFCGEQLTAYRLLEILQKCDLMARRMTDIIQAETAAAQKKAMQTVKSAYQKFLRMLPGHVLDTIPVEDNTIQEIKDVNNNLTGIGMYKFLNRLGQGSFSVVYKATHPEYGTCVVKVLSKARTGKSMASLFCLDREICLSLYLQPHPNVLRAFTALNTSVNFCLVMEYGGPWHLHRFVKEYLKRSGRAVLPKAVIKSFGAQQAAAVEHLHSANVCHRDLKPDNWVVNEAGDTLRLSDLGLAMQVVGVSQVLHQTCGSLPFCAPEVFGSDQPGHAGYDGFSADIWSLGVNWMELIMGPYSIEKLMGWVPKHPSETEVVMTGLQLLPARWQSKTHEDETGMGRLIAKMVNLEPRRRWRIAQICGSQGLNLRAMAHQPRPSGQSQHDSRSGDFGRAEASTSSTSDLFDHGPCQSVRLGGFSVLSAAFKQMLDSFLATSGYNQAYMTRPAKLSALQKLFQQEVPNIFDADPGSKEEVQVQHKVKELHCGLPICNCHMKVMTNNLLAAFSDFGLPDMEAAKAIDRFSRLIPSFTGNCDERIAQANLQNNEESRRTMLGEVKEQVVSSFGESLVMSINSDPVLRRTALIGVTPADVETHLLQYLSCDPKMTDASPVPWQFLKGERIPPRLVYVEVARAALENSGMQPEVIEVIYYTLMGNIAQIDFELEL